MTSQVSVDNPTRLLADSPATIKKCPSRFSKNEWDRKKKVYDNLIGKEKMNAELYQRDRNHV